MSLEKKEALPKPFSLGSAAWVRALERIAPLRDRMERTFPVLVNELAERHGNAPALLSVRETLSFHELAARVNRYTRWTLEQDFAPGTVVGLLMQNQADYLAIWLGLTQAGCVAALLNTHLSGASLAHCLDVADVKHVIAGEGFAEVLASALPLCQSCPEVSVHGPPEAGHRSITSYASRLSDTTLQKAERRLVTLADRALCIYTSGTTGLPKAANVSHHRIMSWSHWFAGMMDTQPADRLYNCLPFYHAMGGVAASGALLVSGGSVFISEKFSAGRFWEEVCGEGCTIFQYIGELCRYLLSAPPSAYEQDHRLRLCCGNGLAGDIWQAFQARFKIPHILEFYAATEANFSLYNVDEEPGAIGRVPAFLAHRFPIELIKVDAESLVPVRNDGDLCVPAAPGEAGEAIFKIAEEASTGAASFEGYTSAKDSGKKILRSVKAKDDIWYRSGDLMRRDARGFFTFAGRIGDSFRWKGENVSALEVTQVIAAFPGVCEALVYGVAVPNADGRAGMAALSIDGTFDFQAFKAYLDGGLPRYAQPLFLRVVDRLELTSTFRPKKADFSSQGLDPALVGDPLYFNDEESGAFVKLDACLYEAIAANRIKL